VGVEGEQKTVVTSKGTWRSWAAVSGRLERKGKESLGLRQGLSTKARLSETGIGKTSSIIVKFHESIPSTRRELLSAERRRGRGPKKRAKGGTLLIISHEG